MIRILIADDHAELRSGLTQLFAATPGLVVVATAADGEQAVALAADHRPEVIVMDVLMPPGIDGIEATKRILAADSHVRVIVLTSSHDRYAEAIGAGAVRYLLKDGEPGELLSAVRAAASTG